MNTTISETERQELAPSGELLVAVAVGPAVSAVWCTRDPATGSPVGVTVSLAREMASRIGLPLRFVQFSSSGDIVANADNGSWTLSFVPIDDDRRRSLAVGPDYYQGVSTFLARKDEFTSVKDVDRDGVRIAGITGTATLRSAEKWVRHASVSGIASLQDAVRLFRDRQVDALAIGMESILSLLADFPGCHAVDGYFHQAGTAVVVPRQNQAALEAVSRLVATLKSDGTIRKIFDLNGMSRAEVAP